MSSRRRGKLGEFIVLKRGYDLPRSLRRPGRIPLISSSGISDHVDLPKVAGPGVVTGRYGTIGKVFFCRGDYWPLNTTLYVSDFKGNDPRFISYFLQTINFLSASDKAAVPGVNRNHLHELEVEIPSIESQTSISTTLGALDDRIELLRATNSTLEAIAQALFKSWFVDFDPVRAKSEGRVPEGMDAATADLFPDSFEDSPIGPIPAGWRVESLDGIATFLNGLAMQKYPPIDGEEPLPVVKIAQLRKGTTEGAGAARRSIKPDFVVRDGDVLFSWSGSLEVEIWCGGEGALNQHLFKLSSTEFKKWFYFFWTRHHLPEFRRIASGKATTMGHIQRSHLSDAKVVIPSAHVMKLADARFAPLVDRMILNSIAARSLGDVRDALLPRLVSGRLRVPVEEGDA